MWGWEKYAQARVVADDLEAKVSMISEFIDMVKTGPDSRPNEDSLVVVAEDGQPPVLQADYLPYDVRVQPQYYDYYCRNPAEYAMLFPSDMPVIELYSKYLSSLPNCAAEDPGFQRLTGPAQESQEVIAFKGPKDHDVVHTASVVPDEVMMIDTCVPSRTRS